MLDHVTVRVGDREASRAFYEVALGRPSYDHALLGWGDFFLAEGTPCTRRLHIAFGVHDRDEVDAWWQRLIDAGHRSDGAPGVRPQYSETYYGGFVLDPDGNSVEAVHHQRSRRAGIDHLWLRTRNIAATRAFYETIAPMLGLQLMDDAPDRIRFATGGGSFTFVLGAEPTQQLHLAIAALDLASVQAFHAAAIAAGHRDNGAPGERAHHQPGYYSAYVLDPDRSL